MGYCLECFFYHQDGICQRFDKRIDTHDGCEGFHPTIEAVLGQFINVRPSEKEEYFEAKDRLWKKLDQLKHAKYRMFRFKNSEVDEDEDDD